ncbi:hypothetical protein ALC62_09195 [Cyphomyrmex costatus]|uniref:SAP domain-containing protein n=1 Tax=Cyphomyrmex costatus TaxID=456900 RepID=A0A151IFZ7_9HYME|nr:hypothetical protein ALC62_09195 [Cyphomyrmex costatus]
MKDPKTFTLVALKEKLRQLNRNVSGNKIELIARLDEADPTRQWIQDLEDEMNDTEEGAVGGIDRDGTTEEPMFALQGASQDASSSLLQKERDLDKRERELLGLEVELMRRENSCVQLWNRLPPLVISIQGGQRLRLT